jgi:glucose/arabinose dehydrogenase
MALVLCVQLLYCKAMFTLIRSLPCGLILLLAGIVTTPLAAQQFRQIDQDNPGIRVEQLITGLGIPWGLTFLSPNQLLFTQRAGRVHLLDIESASVVNLSGTPEIVAEGQGGLLDVAIVPNYSCEGWIYFTYSKPSKS